MRATRSDFSEKKSTVFRLDSVLSNADIDFSTWKGFAIVGTIEKRPRVEGTESPFGLISAEIPEGASFSLFPRFYPSLLGAIADVKSCFFASCPQKA